MSSEDKKVVINLPEGATQAEVIIREGQAIKILDPKAPVKINLSGVIGTPVEFLTKRLSEADQINPKRCHVVVNRERLSIILTTEEHDEYLSGTIKGVLSMHPKFEEFGINAKKIWDPAELGQFFKMNRSFFASLNENMKLVSDLKNFTAKVDSTIDKQTKENGSRKESYGQVVNSNLPEAFALKIPIFKGVEAQEIQVEVYATIDGSDVQLQLYSPAANQLIEESRDTAINEQVEAIRVLSPDIAIIEQ